MFGVGSILILCVLGFICGPYISKFVGTAISTVVLATAYIVSYPFALFCSIAKSKIDQISLRDKIHSISDSDTFITFQKKLTIIIMTIIYIAATSCIFYLLLDLFFL